MAVNIFHTGDIHLGMKFNSYSDLIRNDLANARYESLENMIYKSNDLNSNLFVIAGDLFNNLQVGKKDIEKTINILNKFNGQAILVLPGNHDYDNNVSELWKHFSNLESEKIILLNENKIYNLSNYGLDINVYPAACYNKHSKENNLQWIKEEEIDQKNINILIAHGALEGLSPDIEGNYYYMSKSELENINVDLCLIGHTHIRYPYVDEINNNKIFNAGTHEPDGLDYKDTGSAWFISLNKEENSARKINTGKYKFIDTKISVNSDEELIAEFENLSNLKLDNKIIRLKISGRISKDAYGNLNKLYSSLESKAYHLIIDDEKLKEKIDEDTINKEFTKGSFPYEFLNRLIDDKEALQVAYELIRRE